MGLFCMEQKARDNNILNNQEDALKYLESIPVVKVEDEILFFEKCSDYFKNVENNIPIFNGWDADIIIEDLKVAILWNGKWHYEKIKANHSVKQVQNRDRLKIREIEKCGYKPYIIKDLGKYNLEKVNSEFKLFLINMGLQIK